MYVTCRVLQGENDKRFRPLSVEVLPGGHLKLHRVVDLSPCAPPEWRQRGFGNGARRICHQFVPKGPDRSKSWQEKAADSFGRYTLRAIHWPEVQ